MLDGSLDIEQTSSLAQECSRKRLMERSIYSLPYEVNGVDSHEDPEYVAYEMHDNDTDEDEGEVVLRDLLSAQLE